MRDEEKGKVGELLDCPFCGGDNLANDDVRRSVACVDCGARGPYNDHPLRTCAVATWNTRQDPSGDLREALKGLREYADRIASQMPLAKSLPHRAVIKKLYDDALSTVPDTTEQEE